MLSFVFCESARRIVRIPTAVRPIWSNASTGHSVFNNHTEVSKELKQSPNKLTSIENNILWIVKEFYKHIWSHTLHPIHLFISPIGYTVFIQTSKRTPSNELCRQHAKLLFVDHILNSERTNKTGGGRWEEKPGKSTHRQDENLDHP